jgi:hypothetical protein
MLTDELIEKMVGDIESLPEEAINDLVALATNVWCDLVVHAVSLSRLQIATDVPELRPLSRAS